MLASLLYGAGFGLAAGLLLLFNGRIAGIGGILVGAVRGEDRSWRVALLLGMLAASAVVLAVRPERLPVDLDFSTGRMALAGLVVGIGGRLGSGCTSGHGICGVGRLSPRSLLASVLFCAGGLVTAWAVGGAP